MPNNPTQLERLDATFLLSAPSLKHCPRDDVAEIAFAGRSNAGKSSVLNRITDNKKMAKVSKTPGRTQLLNLFDLKQGGRVVDLPGYGYAKATKAAQATWQKSVNEYLSKRDNLTALVLVTDIRHPNQAYDEELINWAHESQLPLLVLLNKADKLSFSQQKNAAQKYTKQYKGQDNLRVITFSALKGTGKHDVINFMLTHLK